MMAHRDQKQFIISKEAILLTAASIVLSRLVIGNFLFTIPLLVLASRLSTPREALYPVGLVSLVLIITEVIKAKEALVSAEGRILFVITLFMPVVLLAGAALWIAYSDRRLFQRYLIASSVGIIASLLLVIWLSRPSAAREKIDGLFLETFLALMGEAASPVGELAITKLYRAAVMTLGAMLAPMTMSLVGFTSFIALSWQARTQTQAFPVTVSRWQVPTALLWPFLGAWTVVLLLVLFDANYLSRALAMQVGLGIGVIYAVQGLSIIIFWLLKRGMQVRMSRVLLLLFVLIFVIPGVNLLVILALPILGVTENWFTYRSFE